MSKDNQPKLSDVARQANTDKAADRVKRMSSMIPAAPLPKLPSAPEPAQPEPSSAIADQPVSETLAEKIERGEADFAEGRGTVFSVDELKEKANELAPALLDKSSPKTTRARKSGALTIDDVISPEPPKKEPYPHQVRVSEKHHKLLRKLAFTHDKTQNHVLYNLLDLLEQADQRENQKGD